MDNVSYRDPWRWLRVLACLDAEALTVRGGETWLIRKAKLRRNDPRYRQSAASERDFTSKSSCATEVCMPVDGETETRWGEYYINRT